MQELIFDEVLTKNKKPETINNNQFKNSDCGLILCCLKKLSVILILLIYGLSSTGMTVNFHYCCGKLKKVQFSSAQIECGMKMKHSSSKKCCDSKQLELKVKADQKVPEGAKQVSQVNDLPVNLSQFAVASPVYTKFLIPSVFAPPPLASQQLNILYCTFRI